MTAIIQIGKDKAVIKEYKWTSANLGLQDVLNDLLEPDGPSGSDPNPDETAAKEAVKLLGGKFITADAIESKEGVIY